VSASTSINALFPVVLRAAIKVATVHSFSLADALSMAIIMRLLWSSEGLARTGSDGVNHAQRQSEHVSARDRPSVVGLG
jgi:hypothetical protein